MYKYGVYVRGSQEGLTVENNIFPYSNYEWLGINFDSFADVRPILALKTLDEQDAHIQKLILLK